MYRTSSMQLVLGLRGARMIELDYYTSATSVCINGKMGKEQRYCVRDCHGYYYAVWARSGRAEIRPRLLHVYSAVIWSGLGRRARRGESIARAWEVGRMFRLISGERIKPGVGRTESISNGESRVGSGRAEPGVRRAESGVGRTESGVGIAESGVARA
jgi:hypothetical protein